MSSDHGVTKNFYVHRLVAELFIPKIVGKDFVNHKNGNKGDPSMDNLEWCTHTENVEHAKVAGAIRKHEQHWGSKWKPEAYQSARKQMIEALRTGEHINAVKMSLDFGVSVYCIKRLRSWCLETIQSGIQNQS